MIISSEKKFTLSSVLVLGLLILVTVVSLLIINELRHTIKEAKALELSLQNLEQAITYVKAVIVGAILVTLALLLNILMIRRSMEKQNVEDEKGLKGEKWLKDAQQLAKMGMWEYDVNLEKLVLADSMYELWQMNRYDQAIPTVEQFLEKVHPEDVEEVQQRFMECIHLEEVQETEYRVWISGQQKFFLTIAKPVKEADGKIIKIRGITQDITERKRVEEDLLKSVMRFSTIFRLNPLPIAITRLSDGKILDANDKALEAFGFTHQEIVNHTTIGLNIWAKPHDRALLLERLKRQPSLQFEATYRSKEGKEWNAITCLEVIELEGEQYMLIILQDITGRKQVEEAIKVHSQQLEKLNANKDRFFSIIAHDLMSPVNGVISSADVLSSHIDHLNQQEIRTFADNIFNSVYNLKRLLSNLLEWARMQSGDMYYQPREVNLQQIASDVINLLQENAHKKDISLHNLLPKDFMLKADENMLHSIFRNLVSNAIKFSPIGGMVQIQGQRLPNQLQVSISDNGIGMSQLVQQQLFRIDSKHTSLGTANEKGTGLGLLLCKEFVEMQKGSISVESEEGKGTTFTISFPV